MEPVPSLREVFETLADGSADPASALAHAGYGDLPDHLVSEAIVSYADTAPVEVAEHLSPFVMAHSAVPQGDDAAGVPDTHTGLELLSTAPSTPDTSHDDAQDDAHDGLHDDRHADGGHEASPHEEPHEDPASAADHHGDLLFGAGEQGGGAEGGHHGTGPDVAVHLEGDTVGHELGHEPLVHEAWFDVTSPSFAPDLDEHVGSDDDWAHHHVGHGAEEAAPEPLDDHHDDGALDGGAGA